MGSALAKLNQQDEALEEFKKAYMYSPPKSAIRQLAQTALARYGQSAGARLPTANTIKETAQLEKAAQQQQQQPDDMDTALLKATGGVPGGADPLGQAINSIHKQTSEKESSMVGNAKDDLRRKTDDAEAQCQAIQSKTKQKIAEMQTAVIHGLNGNLHIYSDEDIADVQRRADDDCERIRRSAKSKGTSSLTDSQDRAVATEQSALNLERQFKDSRITGSGVRLMPQGTNLFTRNYKTYRSTDDERASVTPMIAQPKRLSDVAASKKSEKPTAHATDPQTPPSGQK
jgi:hypothetical protein